MQISLEHQTYQMQDCAAFKRAREEYGGFSNMSHEFPLKVNGIAFNSSEALYQCLRFPHLPKVQELIIASHNGMASKIACKAFIDDSRPDWATARIDAMRWCLRVKLAQHWETFGELLRSSGDKPIVENSNKDDFWGAKPCNDGSMVGANVLGQLLMELREQYLSADNEALKSIPPIPLENALLLGQSINPVENPSGA